MGKNLIQQARGRGSPRYLSKSFRHKGHISHNKTRKETHTLRGEIIDIIHCQGHTAPLMKVKYEDKQECLHAACEGIRVGDEVYSGVEAPVTPGSTLLLKNIPEGTLIYNIEIKPGDGGKLCRTSGTCGRITAKLPDRIIVQLPSKKEKILTPECRATIGRIAGSGRRDKPFYKAGNRYHKMRAHSKLYPQVSGNSQNAVDHPYGKSRSSKKGKPTIAPKNAPPGRKVGKISPRRTGHKN